MIGLDGLKGLFQWKQFYDSVSVAILGDAPQLLAAQLLPCSLLAKPWGHIPGDKLEQRMFKLGSCRYCRRKRTTRSVHGHEGLLWVC